MNSEGISSMKPKTPIPWKDIRLAFETGTSTVLQLSSVHHVARSAIYKRISKEDWVEGKRKLESEVDDEALAQVKVVLTERKIKQKVEQIDKSSRACDLAIDQIERALSDPDQFFRHLTQKEEIDQEGSSRTITKSIEEQTFKLVNGRNAKDLAGALFQFKQLRRMIDDVMSAAERENLALSKARLELDQKKAGVTEEIENETGVALMPATDFSLLDKALPDPGGQNG
jgi:hypothetical protein